MPKKGDLSKTKKNYIAHEKINFLKFFNSLMC